MQMLINLRTKFANNFHDIIYIGPLQSQSRDKMKNQKYLLEQFQNLVENHRMRGTHYCGLIQALQYTMVGLN